MKIDKKLLASVTKELEREPWFVDMDDEGKQLAIDNEYSRRLPISDYVNALYRMLLNKYGKVAEFDNIIHTSPDPKLRFNKQNQRQFLIDFLQPELGKLSKKDYIYG